MLFDLVQSLLRAAVSLELVEISVLSITLHPANLDFSQVRHRLYLHCTDRRFVLLHSLHLKIYSHMLLDLVQPFLRAIVSHEFTEVSITSTHACTIWIFHTSVYDCTFIAPTDGLYF